MSTNHKKSNVYIVGASGFGREVQSWTDLSGDFNSRYSIKGYLDDNLSALDGFPSDYQIVGKIDDFHFKKEDFALLCISNPLIKEAIVKRLNNKVQFLSFIHGSTIIGKNVDIGEGTIIGPNCVLTSNILINRFVNIIAGSIIGHDSVIGEFSSIMVHVTVSGKVKLGRYVFIGNNSNIAPGKKIGDLTKICAGSVVMSDIQSNSFAWGNPAKRISNNLIAYDQMSSSIDPE
jgi:sugar O-acyltransferase (sialic acid O-acetyltransferase NeuD family)